jgi:LmbE family N-acetylglucosaminyl deacetylase
MTDPDERLPRLPDESFQRVLCVAAHPDDNEYGVSGAVATWTRRGVEVSYLLLTRGEAGMDQVEPEEAAGLRAHEQRAACDAVGVERLDYLDHPDGVLEHTLALRRDIARHIRLVRPDVVVTGSWEIVAPWGLNQADHRAAGLATLDAVRDAGNRWVFRELLSEGLEPWSVRWFLVAGDSQPTHGVELDADALERAVLSLEAHREYLAGIPGHPAARDLVPMFAGWGGKSLGVEHAALFRAWDFEAPPEMQG